MAPKKNAFFAFLKDIKNNEIKKGNKPPSLDKLADELTPVWNSMTDKEKDKYKRIANKLNENRQPQDNSKQIINLHSNSNDYWSMKNYLTDLFEFIPNNTELLNKTFILLHINCHTHDGEQYYFPAEIAALEFSLTKGVTRSYHQIIGLSKICPRGFAGSMRAFSDRFHQISCWDVHPDNYEQILLDFLSFLKNNDNHADVYKGVLDLPYMYTMESAIGVDMMKMKNSLKRLYQTVFPDHVDRCKSIFKIASVELLLFEITKKMKIHLDEISLRSTVSIHEVINSDMYGLGLGCTYHETRDISFKCSKSRILQWMSNICKHINEHTGLHLVPGKHVAIELKDGSRMIIENECVPLSKQELKLSINTLH